MVSQVFCNACKRRQGIEVGDDFKGTIRVQCRRQSCGRWFTVSSRSLSKSTLKLVEAVKGLRRVARG
jgi:hypothetical protein